MGGLLIQERRSAVLLEYDCAATPGAESVAGAFGERARNSLLLTSELGYDVIWAVLESLDSSPDRAVLVKVQNHTS